MYRSYSKFLEELQKAIRKRYGEGKPREIRGDLVRLSERFQIEISEAETARKSIENKFMNEWVSERTELSNAGLREETTPTPPKEGNKKESSPLIPLQRGTKNTPLNPLSRGELDLAKVGGKLNADVFRAIDRGLRNNMSMKQISDLVRRVGVLGEHHSRTAGRTAKMGKLRTEYLANHLKAGCKEFKYAGPTGASATQDEPRDFCRQHLGKIYTVEQILKLNNGQGLSVLIYMGGYNCRHRWEAVYGNDELRNANEDKNAVENSELVNGVQVHKSWSDNLKRFEERNMTEEIKKYHRERDAAEKMASIGKNMGLNSAMKNNLGGQSDVTWDGQSTEIKTPESSKGASVARILDKPDQDNLVVIHLKQPFASDKERATALRRLAKKKESNPKLRIFLLHDYNSIVKIEEVI